MTNEQEQPITPAVIAMRQKKGLAIATGNPLDKIELEPKETDKKQVQTEQTLIERVVSMMQRRKRALQMKRRKPRIVRARNIKKNRLATQDQLMRRAMRMAKTMLRKRAAGARGASYNKLSPAQKMNIDRQIEPRTKNIKAMATRLMPRVKAGEMKRLNAVRTHKSTKGVYGNVQNLTQSYQPVIYSKLLGEKVSSEDLNAMFTMYEGFVSSALAPVRLATKIAGGAAVTAAALQTPDSTAKALGAATLYGYNKLANLGKGDPDEKKKDQADKHAEKMKTNQQKLAQQALIQSKEKTKQAQLTTKQMQAKKAGANKPRPLSSFTGSSAQQQTVAASAPAAPSTSATPTTQQQASNTYTPPSNFAQRISQVKKQAVAQTRQQKQTAAAKAARQQMGLVNSFELDNGDPLSEKKGGLWDNIHAKRKRIKAGSGERMRKPGSEGAPTKQNFIDAQEGIGAGFEGTKKLTDKYKKVTPC